MLITFYLHVDLCIYCKGSQYRYLDCKGDDGDLKKVQIVLYTMTHMPGLIIRVSQIGCRPPPPPYSPQVFQSGKVS